MFRISTRSARARQARLDQPPVDVHVPRPTQVPELLEGFFSDPAYPGSYVFATAPGMTLKVFPGTWDETDGETTVVGKWFDYGSNTQIGEDNDTELLVTPDMVGVSYIVYFEIGTRDGVSVYNYAPLALEVYASTPAPLFWRVTTPISASHAAAGVAITKPTYEWTGDPLLAPYEIDGEWWKNGNPTGVKTSAYSDTVEGDAIFWVETATNINGVKSLPEPQYIINNWSLAASTSSICYVSTIAANYRANMISEVATRIDGLDGGAANMDYLSTVDHANKNYVFNENLWCADLRHQLSANMVGESLGNPDAFAGNGGFIMITPRHFLTCAHRGQLLPSGWPIRLVRFFTHDNKVVDAKMLMSAGRGRNIDATNSYQDFTENTADWMVGLLDRDMNIEGIPCLPLLSAGYRQFNSVESSSEAVPLIGFSQTRRSNIEFVPWSDYPANYQRMIYIKDSLHRNRASGGAYDEWDYNAVSGDSGTPSMILVNDRLYIYGVLTWAPFAPSPTYYHPNLVKSQQELFAELIDKCDEKAMAAGLLSEMTGLRPAYAPFESLMSHPLPEVVVSPATPYRGWLIGNRIQTDVTKPTINIRSSRVIDASTLTGTINSQRVRGTIKEGPLYNSANGVFWYRIDFDNGISGWVGADNLENVSENVAPVATNASVTAIAGTPLAIVLAATDADGDPLTYAITAAPSKGNAILSGNTVNYTAPIGQSGADSFQFTTFDGALTSAPATVAITITAVNRAPVAQPQSVSTPEDTAKAITLAATDQDGHSLTYAVVAGPANGVLSGTAPNLTYTPNANYHGADGFTYKANDGQADSNIATVTISVTPVNDAPVAIAQTVAVPYETATTVTLTGTDPESNPLTYSVVDPPTSGGLTGTAPNLTYTPNSGFSGSDSFTFRVNDGTTNSATVTVVLNVAADNSELVSQIYDRTLTTVHAYSSQETVGENAPASNVLDGNSNTFWHTQWDGIVGVEESEAAPPHFITLRLDSVQQISGLRYSPRQDSSFNGVVTAYEIHTSENGTDWTLRASGTWALTKTNKDVAFTPVTGQYIRLTSFDTYATASEIRAFCMLPYVEPPPEPPFLSADPVNVVTDEGVAVAVVLSGSHSQSLPLTYEIVDQPTRGTISAGTGPNRTYTPTGTNTGYDSFTYRVTDGAYFSGIATVSVYVAPEGGGTVIPGTTTNRSSVAYGDFVWTFSTQRPVGYFVNGEPYVIGPVTVTSISPAWNGNDCGSMKNPIPETRNGFTPRPDAPMLAAYRYDSAKNVATQLPLTLQPGDVLVSSNTVNSYPNYTLMHAALTVLGTVPPAGSFRPPPYGTDRTVRFNESQIDWSILKNHAPVSGTPSKAEIDALTPALPWFDWGYHPTSGFIHGWKNASAGFAGDGVTPSVYGREIARKWGYVGLWLNTNQPFADKKRIAIQTIQCGIDIQGYFANGGTLFEDGGHKCGRKLPVVMAAAMLKHPLLEALARTNSSFQEDRQTWIVTQYDVGRVLNGANETYQQGDVGMGEWGVRHRTDERLDDRRWSATYRNVVWPNMSGPVVAAEIMGLRSLWNHPAIFTYNERYNSISGSGLSFFANMRVYRP